ncbi:Signal transduction histidine kinase [Pedococcus dokdonensis]|uniref:histidine kinase n=1 Tax=Pedococcus dokdonensis TaxID=443156 RepID=A0A1H0U9K0_9MICO|nr:HAMP domain-containing sensor histidine kinase [Pedococcus dokdonensis]SDP62811.1 Signal transduction histidine kinase [Pedococcus dokdonensis]
MTTPAQPTPPPSPESARSTPSSRTPAPSSSGRERRRPAGLSTRLLLAQGLLLVAGAGTAWLVAIAIGPGIFHQHMIEAGGTHTPAELDHIERGFRDSLVVALSTGLVAAVLIALVVTWWFSRRLRTSTAAVAASTTRISHGHYDTRVPTVGLGLEFDHLADTVNELATRLGHVEQTRTRLLADLAHEMRTPLASIDAHLEAIEDGVRTTDAATMAVLRGNSRRLHRLANDITTVSRAEEGRLDLRRTPTAAADLLRGAASAAADAYSTAGVSLRTEVNTPATIDVDPDRISQVLTNLLDNALHHTSAPGAVTLSARRGHDHTVELVVTDTGDGISEADLPHIFERFYRADPSRQHRGGSGIGLTISRAIIDAHGGTLVATSNGPGCGATFTATLPESGHHHP